MLAEQARQDLIASDLANVSTPGYKPGRAALGPFGELLLLERGSGAPVGAAGLGVHVAETRLDLSQGPLEETGDPLDIALDGEGFLAVQTPAGVRYTRGGRIQVDPEGRITTASGLPLLDEQGRPIVVGAATPVVAPDGTVSADGRTVARLALVSLRDPAREGEGLFAGAPGPRPTGTAVRQGALEGSGVDIARAMVDMLVSLRAFEALQRAIRAIDETLGRGINGVQP